MKIEGNEMADSLARRAADKIPSKNILYTSQSFMKHEARKLIKDAWCKDWTAQLLKEEAGGKATGLGKFYRTQAKFSIPNFNMKPFNFNKYSRKSQSAYFQARTGIGNTLAFMKKIGKSDTDICNYCDKAIQTTQHLILHCSYFKRRRKKEFKGIIPLTLQVLFNTTFGKNALIRYLSSSNCLSGGKEKEG